MREIEIKCKVQDKDSVIKNLKNYGIKLGDPIKQHDVVFGAPGAVEGSPESVWLRLRTENDDIVYLTLKRSVVGHLDSIEHETIVDNSSEAESIIKELGFELYSDLTKTRQRARHNDIEICLDYIDGLGDFIELEVIMSKDASHDDVVEELWGLLSSFGLDRMDEVHEGYDVMERKLRGL